MLFLVALTLFLSAFLLFICEPMVGKMALPIIGGASSVWTTCVLFFQIMLLGGYLYVHVLGKISRLRDQILAHAALLLIALTLLPIQFNPAPGANPSEAPVTWLLEHLFAAVGIPFLAVSATAPLLQNWLTRTPAAAGEDPYFLYAISNAGSLLSLLAYPILIEPRYGVAMQSRLWRDGYAALTFMVLLAAAIVWRKSGFFKPVAVNAVDGAGAPPAWRTRLFWVAAAFVPSALMLAVTNHISLNIGSVPFIWVGPLAVYLLTFIMAFARRWRFPTRWVSFGATIIVVVLFPMAAVAIPVHAPRNWLVMGCHILILFAGALLCHSSLADARPAPWYLTEFYFAVALGGVLGGIFTAVVAPAIFKTVFEYPLLVALIVFFRQTRHTEWELAWRDVVWLALMGAAIAVTIFTLGRAQIEVTENLRAGYITDAILVAILVLFWRRRFRFALGFTTLILTYSIVLPQQLEGATRIYVARDFFGVKKVLFDQDENMRKLLHGDTMHGLESLDPTLAGEPLSYYHRTGPLGDVMSMLSARGHQHVGVVGLGTGSIAAYGGADRQVTFFDVDPQVVDIARNLFSFVRRCAANCNVIIGDGRFSIQRQPDHEFDLIVLDAFNSDSIPAHLVSREAVRMYMSKLKPDGVLLFHVSNRYLDVEKLAEAVVCDEGLPAFVRYDDDEEPTGKSSSDYVAAVRRTEDFDSIANKDEWSQVERPSDLKSWTDDYSNLMSIVRGIDGVRSFFE